MSLKFFILGYVVLKNIKKIKTFELGYIFNVKILSPMFSAPPSGCYKFYPNTLTIPPSTHNTDKRKNIKLSFYFLALKLNIVTQV